MNIIRNGIEIELTQKEMFQVYNEVKRDDCLDEIQWRLENEQLDDAIIDAVLADSDFCDEIIGVYEGYAEKDQGENWGLTIDELMDKILSAGKGRYKMNNTIFLYKNYTDETDRDCVAYVEIADLKDRHTNIIERFNIHGACYSSSIGDDVSYDDIKTVLTRDEFELLKSGKCTDAIIDRLLGEDNAKMFDEIIEEEKQYLWGEYRLSEDQVDEIFDEYRLDYRDRGVVGYVFDTIDECAREEAFSLGYVNGDNERWFDFEKFGEDLLEGEGCFELRDGRIVLLMY